MTDRMPLILCIDDDARLRADLVDELQRGGYRVLAAEDAQSAYEVLGSAERPDLILCDISMPNENGYDVLETLRNGSPQLAGIPFVFLTGLAGRDQVILGRTLGADDYLTKPVDYDLLLATVAGRLAQVNRIRQHLASQTDSARQRLALQVLQGTQDSLHLSAGTLDRMAIGFFLIDPEGHVETSNRVGQALLDDADGLALIRGRLVAAHPSSAGAFRSMIGQVNPAATETALVLERDFRRPLLVRFSAVLVPPASGAPGLVVTVVDPERMPALSWELARKLYRLTPTEAKIAISVAEGLRPDEISSQFGIAQSTINFHLNNVFRKTGTSRQADLVALLVRTVVDDRPAS